MKTRKLAALAFAVLMLASMATTVAAAAEASPFAETISPLSPEKVTFSAFIVQQPTGMTDITTNTFTKWLEEKTNVHLDMNVVQNDGSKDKLTLMLASNDYPEILCMNPAAAFNIADLAKYG